MPDIFRYGAGALGLFIGLILFSFMNSPNIFPFADTIFPIIQACLMGLGMYGMMPRQMSMSERLLSEFTSSKVSKEELENVVATGIQKVDTLLEISESISDASVSLKVEKIARVADRIFEGFISDPEDIRRSRDFLDIYLDKTIDIISKYAMLENKGSVVTDKLSNVKELLDTIESAFEAQYEKNLEDDLLDLTVQTTVLEKKINQSGI